MENKYLIIIVAVILFCIAIFNDFQIDNDQESQLNPETYDYLPLGEAEINWDENTNEFKVQQVVLTEKDFKNIKYKVDFYKGDEIIDSKIFNADKTNNKEMNINFTIKLEEEPNNFLIEIVNASEV